MSNGQPPGQSGISPFAGVSGKVLVCVQDMLLRSFFVETLTANVDISSGSSIIPYITDDCKDAFRELQTGDYHVAFIHQGTQYSNGQNLIDRLIKQNCAEEFPTTIIVMMDDVDTEFYERMTRSHFLVAFTPIADLAAYANFGIYLSGKRRQLQAMHKELVKAYEEMKKASTKDGPTGLFNAAYFLQMMEREVSFASRKTRDGGVVEPLAVLMADLDNFKRYNDTYGHPEANKALVLLADVMRRGIRQEDIAGRVGGEEFAILFRGQKLEEAKIVGERIRSAFEEESAGLIARCTVSIGIVQWKPTETDDDLYQRVDRALYAAKHNGRNCVAVDEDSPSPKRPAQAAFAGAPGPDVGPASRA